MRLIRALLAAALAAWVLVPVLAGDGAAPDDEEPRPSGRTEEVEVRAATPGVEDLAAFSTVIDLGQAASRGLDVEDFLRRAPSARVSSYGGVGQFATVSLRGSSAEQVTVRIDGVPQNRALGGAVDLAEIPASQIETITVFRGFPPASAGLTGLGGLVDIRTRRAERGQQAHVDVLAGSLGTRRLAASWNGGTPSGAGFRVGVEALETDGDFRFVSDNGTAEDESDDFWAERINNDVRAVDLVASAYDLTSLGADFSVSARYRSDDRGIPGVDALPTPDTRLEGENASLHARWVWGRGERATELLVDGFADRDHLVDDEGSVGVGVGYQDQTTRHVGAGVALTTRWPGGRHRVLGRLELRAERASVRDEVLSPADRGGARRWLAAAVVEDVFDVGAWTLAPAVRYEQRRDAFAHGAGSGVALPADDVSEGNWTGKLGAVRPLGRKGWSLRGSVGRYVRVPSLQELFGDRGLVVGNPALDAETGTKLEVGVESAPPGAARRWQVSVAGFASRTDDLILFVPTGLGTVKARNVAAAEVVGLEASASLRVRPDLWLEASATLQRARDVSRGFTRDMPLVGVPDKLGYVGLRFERGAWGARYDIAYVGPNSTDRIDDPAFRLPSRAIHDVGVEWAVGGGLRVGLEVRNLLDQQARDVLRFPLPGRMVLAHVGWDWSKGAGR